MRTKLGKNIGYIIFVIGLLMKISLIPYGFAFFVLGAWIQLTSSLIRLVLAFTKKQGSQKQFYRLVDLSIAAFMNYLVFSFQFWGESTITFYVASAIALSCVVFYLLIKPKRNISLLIFILALVSSSMLMSVPTHELYYRMHEDVLNSYTDGDMGFQPWIEYSWHLYEAGEYELALIANKNAIHAAYKYLEVVGGDWDIINEIKAHNTAIVNRSWRSFYDYK
ncbi:MAG: hypothetical protein IIA45_16140 [Bacteroidetes bacterium]|nr:hypothetical protein [Bacteroidota bacterium]